MFKFITSFIFNPLRIYGVSSFQLPYLLLLIILIYPCSYIIYEGSYIYNWIDKSLIKIFFVVLPIYLYLLGSIFYYPWSLYSIIFPKSFFGKLFFKFYNYQEDPYLMKGGKYPIVDKLILEDQLNKYNQEKKTYKKENKQLEEEQNQKDIEVEKIINYITNDNLKTIRTIFFNQYQIELVKKMYVNGLKEKQELSDILLDIETFFILNEYHDMELIIDSLKDYLIDKGPLELQDDYEENVNYRIRESISQSVKDKVWNRDGGKCVQCGSNEKIEFDHIIPFSKGGSNTYRNLQILCEKCNRQKSDKIG